MPNTNSSKKRLRQNATRRERNRTQKSALRTQLRKVRAAVAEEDIGKAEQEMAVATKTLDRAGAKKLIHPNAAARSKSRLQKLIRKAKQAS